MTPNVFPADFSHINDSEKQVLGWLMEQVDDPGVEIFCQVEWLDGHERREIDLLVSVLGMGLCIIEVKGGPVDIAGNQWRQWRRESNEMEPVNFHHQLAQEHRILRDILSQGEKVVTPKIGYLLVTPDSEFHEAALLPGMSRHVLVAKNERSQLWERVKQSIDIAFGPRDYEFTGLEQLKIQTLLTSREETYSDIVAGTRFHAQTVDQLSLEQSFIMELLEDNARVLVSGGPGSGKTIVAIEEACRLAQHGQAVALMCFNKGLAALLRHKTRDLDNNIKPQLIGTVLDSLRRFVGIPEQVDFETSEEKSAYFEETLPQAILEKLSTMNVDQKFDAVVLDEMQDFTPVMWQLAIAALKNPETGRIIAFGDKEQVLTRQGVEPDFHAVKVQLKRNLRSSRFITEVLNDFYEQDMLPSGTIRGVKPEMHVIPDGVNVYDEVESLIQTLNNGYGWNRGDIVVLSVHYLSQQHKDALQALGDDGYWDSFFTGNDVFYSHVNSFKGLERPMVIVALDGFSGSADAFRQLFVSASRARDDLIFVGTQGDLDRLNHVQAKLDRISNASD